jgi:hypothetical protein
MAETKSTTTAKSAEPTPEEKTEAAKTPTEPTPTQPEPKAKAAEPKAKAAEPKEPKALPIAAHNDSFYATLDENANGIPTVSILPVGWVGAAPLQIPESELKDLIKVLNQLKR